MHRLDYRRIRTEAEPDVPFAREAVPSWPADRRTGRALVICVLFVILFVVIVIVTRA